MSLRRHAIRLALIVVLAWALVWLVHLSTTPQGV